MARALVFTYRRGARLLAAPLIALALLVAFAGVAEGREPMRELDGGTTAPSPEPTGYDISYPQCGDPFPTNVAFGIVGVNHGIVYSPNPCLGAGDGPSELAWAGPNAELYANTANPGPELSSYWPIGQTDPRVCSADDPDSADCAYVYGWNAAADSYAAAVQAYISLGWAEPDATRTPIANAWWFDVETANSWRDDPSLNVAALQGAVDYLDAVGAASVGFYSEPGMWGEITGDTTAFANRPSWVAGAFTLEGAKDRCDGPGFTGGGVGLTQYFHNGFDANHRC